MTDYLLAALGCFVALAVAGTGFIVETDLNVVGIALAALGVVVGAGLLVAGAVSTRRPTTEPF